MKNGNGNGNGHNGNGNGNGHLNGNGHSHSTTVTAFDYLIVGAGYAGSVLAERLAREFGDQPRFRYVNLGRIPEPVSQAAQLAGGIRAVLAPR